jgi:D-alanyl-D-alanine carboxypeptidase (penicillin-binding protein 5/6)
MVIQSGNDASVALAEAIGGSEDQFAAMMNRTAQRLGLKDTNFLNASGYFEGPAPKHYSTARDLARLAAALIRDHPETHALHAMKEYTYNGIRQHNRNRLLWADPTVDGLKTGTFQRRRLLPDRHREARPAAADLGGARHRLRRRPRPGFAQPAQLGLTTHSTPVKLYDKGQAISQLKVFKGVQNLVGAGFAEDFVVSVPRGMADKVAAQLVSRSP